MKNTVAVKEIVLEIIPRLFDLIHPLSPRVRRKKRKLETKIKDNVLCRLKKFRGICPVSTPLYSVILDAVNVHASEHISNPAIDNVEKDITQSINFFLIELTIRAPRKAKENPATRALIKADCLQTSAKFSGVKFMGLKIG